MTYIVIERDNLVLCSSTQPSLSSTKVKQRHLLVHTPHLLLLLLFHNVNHHPPTVITGDSCYIRDRHSGGTHGLDLSLQKV